MKILKVVFQFTGYLSCFYKRYWIPDRDFTIIYLGCEIEIDIN